MIVISEKKNGNYDFPLYMGKKNFNKIYLCLQIESKAESLRIQDIKSRWIILGKTDQEDNSISIFDTADHLCHSAKVILCFQDRITVHSYF